MASALATSTFAGKAVVAKAPSAGVARKAVVTKAYQYIVRPPTPLHPACFASCGPRAAPQRPRAPIRCATP